MSADLLQFTRPRTFSDMAVEMSAMMTRWTVLNRAGDDSDVSQDEWADLDQRMDDLRVDMLAEFRRLTGVRFCDVEGLLG